MITFEEIDIDEAISHIFKTSNFPILKSHIEDEVIIDGDKIFYEYVNGKDLSANIYTNKDTSKYQWIAVIQDSNVVAPTIIAFHRRCN